MKRMAFLVLAAAAVAGCASAAPSAPPTPSAARPVIPPEFRAGIGNSDGFELTVHPGSLDVTITVTGPAGNA